MPSLRTVTGSAGTRLLGLGHHQPEKTLTNDDIAKLVETNDEWIRSRTGIVTRHVAADDVTVADMAAAAARNALDDAQVPAEDVDLVIVATTTARDMSPNTAGRVAYALRTGNVPVRGGSGDAAPESVLAPWLAAQPASTTARTAPLATAAMRLALATLTSSHLHPPGVRLASAPPRTGEA